MDAQVCSISNERLEESFPSHAPPIIRNLIQNTRKAFTTMTSFFHMQFQTHEISNGFCVFCRCSVCSVHHKIVFDRATFSSRVFASATSTSFLASSDRDFAGMRCRTTSVSHTSSTMSTRTLSERSRANSFARNASAVFSKAKVNTRPFGVVFHVRIIAATAQKIHKH